MCDRSAKGGGVFVNPASSSAPPKLRLVYECAPLALIVEVRGVRPDRPRHRVPLAAAGLAGLAGPVSHVLQSRR